jgi:hypothetical protein
MVIPFTPGLCPSDVCFVVRGHGIITVGEVCSSVKSDGGGGSSPLCNHIKLPIHKTIINPTEVEGTVVAESFGRFGYVHGHINSRHMGIRPCHVYFIVSALRRSSSTVPETVLIDRKAT